MTFIDFQETVEHQVAAFETATLVKRVAAGRASLRDYHTILTTILHQTRNGPYTFALAAAHCPWKHAEAKEYLLRHALEEHTHWKWVIDDLQSTGFMGADPACALAHSAAEAYVSYNEHLATRMPVARLATASVLEGIGARFGGKYGGMFLTQIGIKPNQATFFLSHGETDKAHIEDLAAVIARLELDDDGWRGMSQAAAVGGALYRAMYSHEGYE